MSCRLYDEDVGPILRDQSIERRKQTVGQGESVCSGSINPKSTSAGIANT
jgi:hypothetical protein